MAAVILGQSQHSQSYQERKMPRKSIPNHVRQEVTEIIDHFDREVLGEDYRMHIPCCKGAYLYLDRDDGALRLSSICRLRYTGDMNKWEFAIYKYSSGRYDPDECFFPFEAFVDGTVEGALKAGMRAYQ